MMTAAASAQSLCYNCFAPRDTAEGPCPYRGFDLPENRAKFPVALQARVRYRMTATSWGRALGQGGFGITYAAFDTQPQAQVAIKEYMPSDIATRVKRITVSVMMDAKTADFTYGAEWFQEEAHAPAKFIGRPNIAGVSSRFDVSYYKNFRFSDFSALSGLTV